MDASLLQFLLTGAGVALGAGLLQRRWRERRRLRSRLHLELLVVLETSRPWRRGHPPPDVRAAYDEVQRLAFLLGREERRAVNDLRLAWEQQGRQASGEDAVPSSDAYGHQHVLNRDEAVLGAMRALADVIAARVDGRWLGRFG